MQYQRYTPLAIPGGLFSIADLLTEDRLVDDPGRQIPTINLNHAVQRVLTDGTRALGDTPGRLGRDSSAANP